MCTLSHVALEKSNQHVNIGIILNHKTYCKHAVTYCKQADLSYQNWTIKIRQKCSFLTFLTHREVRFNWDIMDSGLQRILSLTLCHEQNIPWLWQHLPFAGMAELVVQTPKLDRPQTLQLIAVGINSEWLTSFWTSLPCLSWGPTTLESLQ